MSCVILAAGKGKRMYSDLPKVLHAIAGRPMLRHVVDTAMTLNPEQLCIVYGHGGDLVREALADVSCEWALQDQQLGTGHAVQMALPALPETGSTLVLYGDVPLIRLITLQQMLDAGQGDKMVLLTDIVDDATGYGRIVRDADQRVISIVEEKDASEAERHIREINTGIMLLPNKHLHQWLGRLSNQNAQGEYYLTDVVGMAVADGVEIATVNPAHSWETFGVNSKVQLAELERIHQLELADRLLQQGVTLLDPARVDIRGQLEIGRDVIIDVNCVFEGKVVLGDRVRVGPNTVIKDAEIAADTQVAAFSHIENARVGADSRIGPFARLRPGAHLASGVHIGNFVEIKKSEIGEGSKVNHLSYVGDAMIGKGVNVGAGTITCNYDGVNKHNTVIEDGAFIGSGSMLVAPVVVAKGATIGAGSTITRHAPEDQLTLARARQISIPAWKRPAKDKID
ncbi:bifunctional UDP-N-acetylglucosamine diphosphorylase/glucosamine-1-phosphate N-acetyltransferase GlmU [Chitinivorax sp. B]|uniref:bifunctional UDP-N-acetylglucosamine diphosphorylase/glucosamine-1-phosphate N-acetyltransferase GlmU n=1 Tax=Chitinivorax sp. B TaxID=2502235 RepID=UPI0010F9DE44|nr:bifunctional UDP-N-acetylglucosamine diphosphorylase/glucosamine-1-phosphate N-acetyltransferase GlmU [Chitinivorax sp. B]